MKKRYNKALAFILALTLTGSLASCGSSDQSKSGTPSDMPVSRNSPETNSVSVKTDTAGEKAGASGITADNTDNGDAATEAEEAPAVAADVNGNQSVERIIADAEYMTGGDMTTDMPMPDPGFDGEEYKQLDENGYTFVKDAPLSTFSTDVDTASYANARRMLTMGWQVNRDSVRAEEFINYFSYDYEKPDAEHPIAVTTELSECPWNSKAKLLLVGVQAKDIERETRAPLNLVLLIDVSGSMRGDDRLPLVKQAVKKLAESLNANDRVSIVTYSGEEKIVLEGAAGSDYDKIAAAVDSLEAEGCTAGEAGINMAYKLAEDNFIQGGNNRIVMATDGDLNVGISSEEELKALVEKKREGGVFLSVLGFGAGNLKDARLEALADNGNGNYSYIDSEREAKKVLLSELNATLITVAKDVKAQIEFNPANVEAYRLVGYENRLLADEDFTDDTKDAGEMGAGHSSTALYEIIPVKGVLGSAGLGGSSDDEPEPATADPEELLSVKLRYKLPDGDTSTELSKPVMVKDYTAKAGANLAFASCAAEYAMYLRGSQYSKLTPADISKQLTEDLLTDEYRQEFAELLKMAKELYGE